MKGCVSNFSLCIGFSYGCAVAYYHLPPWVIISVGFFLGGLSVVYERLVWGRS